MADTPNFAGKSLPGAAPAQPKQPAAADSGGNFDIGGAANAAIFQSQAAAVDMEEFQKTLRSSTAIITGTREALLPDLAHEQKRFNDSFNVVTDAIAKQSRIVSYPEFIGNIAGLFDEDWNYDVQTLRQRGAEATAQNAAQNVQLKTRMAETRIAGAAAEVDQASKQLQSRQQMLQIIGTTLTTLGQADQLKYARMSYPDLVRAAAQGDANAKKLVTNQRINDLQLANLNIEHQSKELSYLLSARGDDDLKKLREKRPDLSGAIDKTLLLRGDEKIARAQARQKADDESKKRWLGMVDIPTLDSIVSQGESTGQSFVMFGQGDQAIAVPVGMAREELNKKLKVQQETTELRTNQNVAMSQNATMLNNAATAAVRVYGSFENMPANIRSDLQALQRESEIAFRTGGSGGIMSVNKKMETKLKELRDKVTSGKSDAEKKLIEDAWDNGEITDKFASDAFMGQALVSPNMFYGTPFHETFVAAQAKALETQQRMLGVGSSTRMRRDKDGNPVLDLESFLDPRTGQKIIKHDQMWNIIANTQFERIIHNADGTKTTVKTSIPHDAEVYYGKRAFESGIFALASEDGYYEKFFTGQKGADGVFRAAGVRDKYKSNGETDVLAIVKEMAYDQAKFREKGQEVDYLSALTTKVINPDTQLISNVAGSIKASYDLKMQAFVKALYDGNLEKPMMQYLLDLNRKIPQIYNDQRILAQKDVKAEGDREQLTKSLIEQAGGKELVKQFGVGAPGAAKANQNIMRPPQAGSGPRGVPGAVSGMN